MPIPASAQTIDGVIEGLIAMLASTFGLTQDAVQQVWSGTVDINGTATAAVLCEGQPGSYEPDVIIALDPQGDGINQVISRPTMGSNRSREITAEVKIVFSVFVPGADVAARTARQAVNAMTEPVGLYFRARGNETLAIGGVDSCREAWLSAIDGPHVENALDQEGQYVIGRTAFSTLTITALIRN